MSELWDAVVDSETWYELWPANCNDTAHKYAALVKLWSILIVVFVVAALAEAIRKDGSRSRLIAWSALAVFFIVALILTIVLYNHTAKKEVQVEGFAGRKPIGAHSIPKPAYTTPGYGPAFGKGAYRPLTVENPGMNYDPTEYQQNPPPYGHSTPVQGIPPVEYDAVIRAGQHTDPSDLYRTNNDYSFGPNPVNSMVPDTIGFAKWLYHKPASEQCKAGHIHMTHPQDRIGAQYACTGNDASEPTNAGLVGQMGSTSSNVYQDPNVPNANGAFRGKNYGL